MPITYNRDTGEVGYVDGECPECGESMYSSSCDAPGCSSFGCQLCGVGCDLDFVPDGRCAQALAAATP